MAIQGARARARAEITAEITAEARRQLASEGPTGLSLRAVARELGMVSSAVYRYVRSRDELLTMLIIEAYESLATTVEGAASDAGSLPADEQWVAVASAIRRWALDHPHEYALIYGSPVPGYAAPQDTVDPAQRITRALASIVAGAAAAGRLTDLVEDVRVTPELHADFERVRTALSSPLDDQLLARMVVAWSQLFGLVSFELFGQTRNGIVAHDDLFDMATRSMATFLGLTHELSARSNALRPDEADSSDAGEHR